MRRDEIMVGGVYKGSDGKMRRVLSVERGALPWVKYTTGFIHRECGLVRFARWAVRRVYHA
jgi:hypothetical protein